MDPQPAGLALERMGPLLERRARWRSVDCGAAL